MAQQGLWGLASACWAEFCRFMEGKDITTGHDKIEEVICFYSLGKSFRYFIISCFKHARVNETQSNINMIAAIYHQSAVWINFYDHSWLFHQSLKYRSMLRVSWTEHKTNEDVLNMANTTRSSLPIIKKRKCQYFGHVIRARSIRLNIASGILS